jgi:intraflagellar transport protein 140
MSLCGDTVVVLSGKQGQIIKLRGINTVPDIQQPFDTLARSCVIDDARDQMFLAIDTRLEILNLTGGYKSAITCTDGEGSPIHLHLNGNYLAIVTDRGVIKLYDVSKKDKDSINNSSSNINIKDTTTSVKVLPVRPLGSAGRFIDSDTGASIGDVRSIKCNSDGTRVSLLSDRIHGNAASTLRIREPDTRLHVYDADKVSAVMRILLLHYEVDHVICCTSCTDETCRHSYKLCCV